jgi:hypothetical protein
MATDWNREREDIAKERRERQALIRKGDTKYYHFVKAKLTRNSLIGSYLVEYQANYKHWDWSYIVLDVHEGEEEEYMKLSFILSQLRGQ